MKYLFKMLKFASLEMIDSKIEGYKKKIKDPSFLKRVDSLRSKIYMFQDKEDFVNDFLKEIEKLPIPKNSLELENILLKKQEIFNSLLSKLSEDEKDDLEIGSSLKELVEALTDIRQEIVDNLNYLMKYLNFNDTEFEGIANIPIGDNVHYSIIKLFYDAVIEIDQKIANIKGVSLDELDEHFAPESVQEDVKEPGFQAGVSVVKGPQKGMMHTEEGKKTLKELGIVVKNWKIHQEKMSTDPDYAMTYRKHMAKKINDYKHRSKSEVEKAKAKFLVSRKQEDYDKLKELEAVYEEQRKRYDNSKYKKDVTLEKSLYDNYDNLKSYVQGALSHYELSLTKDLKQIEDGLKSLDNIDLLNKFAIEFSNNTKPLNDLTVDDVVNIIIKGAKNDLNINITDLKTFYYEFANSILSACKIKAEELALLKLKTIKPSESDFLVLHKKYENSLNDVKNELSKIKSNISLIKQQVIRNPKLSKQFDNFNKFKKIYEPQYNKLLDLFLIPYKKYYQIRTQQDIPEDIDELAIMNIKAISEKSEEFKNNPVYDKTPSIQKSIDNIASSSKQLLELLQSNQKSEDNSEHNEFINNFKQQWLSEYELVRPELQSKSLANIATASDPFEIILSSDINLDYLIGLVSNLISNADNLFNYIGKEEPEIKSKLPLLKNLLPN